ncbi:MAG: hypothetical protein ACYS72_03705, partial [Planctomycetota bacterium]
LTVNGDQLTVNGDQLTVAGGPVAFFRYLELAGGVAFLFLVEHFCFAAEPLDDQDVRQQIRQHVLMAGAKHKDLLASPCQLSQVVRDGRGGDAVQRAGELVGGVKSISVCTFSVYMACPFSEPRQ